MSAYHSLPRPAYAGPPTNPYHQVSPMPQMGPAEWGSAPGVQQPTQPGVGGYLNNHKFSLLGGLGGGWAGGAATGAALGTMFAPGIGTAIGGLAGSVIGGLGGEWLGSKADNAMAPKPQAPVTDMASYSSNMLQQGMRERPPIH